MTTDFPAGTILGYPRIGPRRELKKAVEAFWSGTLSGAELEQTAADLRRATRERLADLGLGRDDSSIPDDFSYYDQVLDAAVAVGAIPTRFADLAEPGGDLPLEAYFAIARGSVEDAPLEMTKWFDSNYHYLVPEIDEATSFRADAARLVRRVQEAAADGFTVRPVLVGPVTLLAELRAAGAEWVQLDEPALVSETLEATPEELADAARTAYVELGRLTERPAILVAAPYGSLDAALPALATAPIEAIALDLVRGRVPGGLDAPVQRGLADKVLVGGVIDGRNVWRADLESAFERLESLRRLTRMVAVATSTSLLHVPHRAADETHLPAGLVEQLAFADEKVKEVEVLARGVRVSREAIAAELAVATDAVLARRRLPGVRVDAVRERTAALREADFVRPPTAEREEAQEDLALPPLPTTTIGSFPQTADLRRARARLSRGELTEADYDQAMREEIARVIRLQEELGLDVLVHGEPERNDMVQYFAEHLDGFAVTQGGWVQSYGSRCTRPSILWGDVSRPAPITVDWAAYAQSLTAKPVKGMLTGPVTILAWSFVRDDQSLGETADQVALALRDEIADLEAAGIRIVQVDEPALRELLPLKRRDQPGYLEWSVDAFRLATAGAGPRTQIHTHLCYSEFGAVIGAIGGLDADVTSIEAARSRMEVVADIAASGFARGIGPGVYDIHSPRVPSVEEVEGLLDTALAAIPPRQLWVNPDCGLKTRGYPETIESLRNIVAAAHAARDRVTAGV